MASIAVFVSLGGAATAATVVIKNSKQVATGAINSGDVRNNNLTSTDLKNGAGVGVADLTPAAVAALKGATGPKGETGAQGLQGPKGDKGDTGAIPAQAAPTLISSFENGWEFYDSGTAMTGDDAPVRVWKDFSGTVHLEGAVTNPGMVPAESLIFTLPEGFRPAVSYASFAVLTTGFSDFTEVLGALSVNSNGTVYYEGGNKEYVALDGVTFRAAP